MATERDSQNLYDRIAALREKLTSDLGSNLIQNPQLADALIKAMDRTIAQKKVTYDFARLMEGATEVKCSEFGDALIKNL